MYEQVIYVSRAAPDIDERTAYDIIRTAVNRNSKFQLTGILIFMDGYFLQVLEGRTHYLRERIAIIEADTRHVDVQIRWQVQTEALAFPDDWMALGHGHLVNDAIKQAFDYRTGFPADLFDGPKLLAFAKACHAAQQVG